MLSEIEIDTLFSPLKRYRRAALAVSGGGDSMALMHMARDWALREPAAPDLLVLTVDHGLRPESRREAEQVAEQAAALGLPHHTLTWRDAPADASQAAAREARYDLMADFAQIQKIEALVTAHTGDDVAETFLMRLARGSGIDGLAAIAPETSWDGVPVLRPLLGVSRAQLRAVLKERGATWIDDPSNAEERFERVRIRRILHTLAEIGITRARITESASRLRRARVAIDAAAQEAIAAHAQINAAGYVRLDHESLLALPDEVAIHTLKHVLRRVGGRVRPPRLRKLEMLAEQLRGGEAITTTLGGCVVALDRHGTALTICREPGRLNAAPLGLSSGETVVWDRRFRVTAGRLASPSLRIDALGEANLAALPEAVRTEHPSAALACLPALYSGATLLGVLVREFALADQHSDAAACHAEFLWRVGGATSP
ncbi:MAG: tRNA lysidine(34) synthetase TilS [Dichotomicrobium sp.]